MLKHEGLIEAWHDRRILAGDEFDNSISTNLDAANIILLLVSPDFLASRYCFEIEVARAMERHVSGDARVIPVILRHCDWHHAPFGTLLAAPKDGKPIKSWPDLDEAFLDVVKQVRAALPQQQSVHRIASLGMPARSGSGPRSSNLRLKRSFTDADRDEFLHQAFEYMASFFDNSLSELEARNPSIKTTYRRVDANRFTAAIYQNGNSVARCRILLGGMFGGGISFSHNDRAGEGSSNEDLTVQSTDQSLYLKAIGLTTIGRYENKQLSIEGAAEFYWSLLIGPLQQA